MKTIIIITLSFVSFSVYSQLKWEKGGNNNNPNSAPPIIGTDNTWNSPLIFHTNGTQRMFINNSSGINAGYVGIGLNFSSPIFH